MKIFLQTFCIEFYALEVPKNSNFLTETSNNVKEAKIFIYSTILGYNMLTLFDFFYL